MTHSFFARLQGLLLWLVLPWLLCMCAEAKEVSVGIYTNAPKIFLDRQGRPSGILGDFLNEISRQEGWTLHPVACHWQGCLNLLRTGQVDLVPDVAWTEDRQKEFDFHQQPALHSWSQIYRHPDVKIDSMLDLNGKRLAVLTGSIQQQYLIKLLTDFGVHTTIVPVQSMQKAYEMVAAHELDAVAASNFSGDSRAASLHIEETPVIFQPARLYFASSRGEHADLLRAIDAHLDKWKTQQDSFYFGVLKKWAGAPQGMRLPSMVWWGLATLGGLLLLTMGSVALLRRQVAKKTHQLREQETWLNTILDSVDAYIYIKDIDFRYRYVNHKVSTLFGYPSKEIIGCDDSKFFDQATVARLRNNDQQVLIEGLCLEDEEVARIMSTGETRHYLANKRPLYRPDGKIYAMCGVSTDITQLKQAEETVHQLAFYDSLTLLPNRRLLQEHLQSALTSCTRHHQGGALFFIDLDNFKDLNDTQGHHVGDELLIQAAQRLRACTRDSDTLARLGGDEFVLLLQELDPNVDEALTQVEQASQKILSSFYPPFTLAGQPHQSSVSVGVTLFLDAHFSKEDILRQADLALYQAKNDGRNTVRFFDPTMQARVSARTQLESELRTALSESQLCLYYQPQVDSTGHILGVEALVRWDHPDQGIVGPMNFIPAAESSGLILPMGDWILHTACTQLANWANHPTMAERYIAVNISARQLRDAQFVDKILTTLEQTGAPPSRLKLELTESLLIDDLEGTIAKMAQLENKGVCFSLDDFGTGYSSLSILKRLPFTQLKIDRSFIRDLLTDPEDASITQAIITLGTSLDLHVIAEGVETEAQRQALIRLGCHYFQGYLFSRPVTIDNLP